MPVESTVILTLPGVRMSGISIVDGRSVGAMVVSRTCAVFKSRVSATVAVMVNLPSAMRVLSITVARS